MSSLIFSEKIIKKKIRMSSAAVMINAFRVNKSTGFQINILFLFLHKKFSFWDLFNLYHSGHFQQTTNL